MEKWTSDLSDVLIRVPLIVRTPGGKKGHVVYEQVELFDVMATILDIAGIETSHTHFARSLVPQLHGADGNPDRTVFAEGGYDTNQPHLFEGSATVNNIALDPSHSYWPKTRQEQEYPETVRRAVMIRTLEHKLIFRPGGVHELYDIKKDPRELINIYNDPSYHKIQDELESRLLDWYIHTADVAPLEADSRWLPPISL